MADIRIGNTKWAFNNDTLLAYSTGHNKYKSIPVDSKRFNGKYRKSKDGKLSRVVNNVPTIDYDLANNGALNVETTLTNRNKFSEKFDSLEYTSQNILLTDTAVNSPMDDFRLKSDLNESLMKVTKLYNNTSDKSGLLWSEYANNHRYTLSIFVKKDTARYCGFYVYSNSDDNVALMIYDFDTNTFTSDTTLTSPLVGFTDDYKIASKAIPYGNGWYRLICSFRSSLTPQTNNIEFRAFYKPTSRRTNPNSSVFITGYNIIREASASTTFPAFKSYVKTSGAMLSNSIDILTRQNNIQYMLPKYTANSSRGFTWTMKFILNRTQISKYISLHATGATNSNTSNYFQFNIIRPTTGVYDIDFTFRAAGNSNTYNAGGFVKNALTDGTIKTGKEYHIAVTLANGFLRFSVNGTDANEAGNGSLGNNPNLFAPVIADGQQINDFRIANISSQTNPMPLNIIDMAIYDRSMTQTEINNLTIQ